MFRQILLRSIRKNSIVPASETLQVTPAGQYTQTGDNSYHRALRGEFKMFLGDAADAEWDKFNSKIAVEIKQKEISTGSTISVQGGDRTTKYITKDLTNRVTI